MSSEKERVFPFLKPQDKSDRTTQVAREIADADRLAREKKTAKLKALRLARDAEAAATAPIASAKKPKR